jgi:hypothetical protein
MFPRAIVSLLRAALYAGLGTVLGFKRETIDELILPAVAGGVAGDILTWLLISIITFPRHLRHGVLDTIVNVGFGWFFLSVFGLGVSFENGDRTAIGFLAFMFVIAVKAGYYSIEYLEDDGDEE